MSILYKNLNYRKNKTYNRETMLLINIQNFMIINCLTFVFLMHKVYFLFILNILFVCHVLLLFHTNSQKPCMLKIYFKKFSKKQITFFVEML